MAFCFFVILPKFFLIFHIIAKKTTRFRYQYGYIIHCISIILFYFCAYYMQQIRHFHILFFIPFPPVCVFLLILSVFLLIPCRRRPAELQRWLNCRKREPSAELTEKTGRKFSSSTRKTFCPSQFQNTVTAPALEKHLHGGPHTRGFYVFIHFYVSCGIRISTIAP